MSIELEDTDRQLADQSLGAFMIQRAHQSDRTDLAQQGGEPELLLAHRANCAVISHDHADRSLVRTQWEENGEAGSGLLHRCWKMKRPIGLVELDGEGVTGMERPGWSVVCRRFQWEPQTTDPVDCPAMGSPENQELSRRIDGEQTDGIRLEQGLECGEERIGDLDDATQPDQLLCEVRRLDLLVRAKLGEFSCLSCFNCELRSIDRRSQDLTDEIEHRFVAGSEVGERAIRQIENAENRPAGKPERDGKMPGEFPGLPVVTGPFAQASQALAGEHGRGLRQLASQCHPLAAAR